MFIRPRDPLNPHVATLKPDPGARIVRREDYMAWTRAHDIVIAAQAHATAILADAHNIFEQERRRGYEEGDRQARRQQAEKIIETVGQTVDYLSRFEHEIIDLVMGAVRKIVDGFDDEDAVMAVARNAIAIARNQKQITLRLNPSQVDIVRSRLDELLAVFPVVGYVDIRDDPRVRKGGCILESEIGLIEAHLDDQIEALRIAFERILGSRV